MAHSHTLEPCIRPIQSVQGPLYSSVSHGVSVSISLVPSASQRRERTDGRYTWQQFVEE